MLAIRSIHDLAKPQGLIHHDLPMGGYYLHCYFTYNPSLFHDLATANGYRLVFQEISSGSWRRTPSALRDAGFADEKFRDYGIELVFQKTGNGPFKIPVDNTTSDVVSLAAWTSNDIAVTVSPVLPVDPQSIKTLFARLPFRTVQAAYWSRVKDLIRHRVLPAP
jgi:hypothetical protein